MGLGFDEGRIGPNSRLDGKALYHAPGAFASLFILKH